MTNDNAPNAAEKCKVLVATDEMEVGGSQRQITNLLTGMDRTRFEPVLLYFREHSFLVDEIAAKGIRVHYLPKNGKIDIGFFLSLTRFLKQERFDVIHAYSLTAELWLALARSFARSSLFISSIRGTYDDYSSLQWRIKRWITRRSALVISNSKQAADIAFERMALKGNDCAIVYNGVHAVQAAPVLPDDLKNQRARHDFILTFVGRLGPEKNVPCLFRALRRLKDEGADEKIGVWLVGDGGERSKLEQMAADLSLDQVEFLGERSDVNAVLAHSDAAVLPSFFEGLSNAILEAMAVGKPVIASRVGGSAEIVRHEENGLLFPSDDDQALTDAIRRFVQDPAFAQRLGACGKQDIDQRFSIPSMVEQHQAHYAKAA